MMRVGTIDVLGWHGDHLVVDGVAAVCRVAYAGPNRVLVGGALVPEVDEAVVAELAAGRVSATIEPQRSPRGPVLSRLAVHRPPPDNPHALSPIRRVWA